jgi:hypothetical protein
MREILSTTHAEQTKDVIKWTMDTRGVGVDPVKYIGKKERDPLLVVESPSSI